MACLLLVDDNTDFRTVFQRKFTELGYKVITAPDGVRGLQAVLDTPVDLAVLDLKMAYRNGLETLRLIRSVKPETRVIILSALVDDAAEQEARALGVSVILHKPIGIKDLAESIRQALAEAP
jgi:CheY-like chemotaxis protein